MFVTGRRGLKLAACVAFLSSALGTRAHASLADWHVSLPSYGHFGWNGYHNWRPFNNPNPNKASAASTGTDGDITWYIWDGYGPGGSPGSDNPDARYNDHRDFGGQTFDVKAMYTRTDATRLHVAIATAFNPSGTADPDQGGNIVPGDIALNSDWAHATAQFGVLLPDVAVGSSGKTQLVKGGTWDVPNQNLGASPPPYTNYKSGGQIVSNDVNYAYTKLPFNYYDTKTQTNKWINLFEFSIPLSALTTLTAPAGGQGVTPAAAPGTTPLTLAWSEGCRNDYASVTTSLANVAIPEPATAAVLGVGAIALFGRRRRRRA